jgi:acetone carboxylase gamma subunit
MGAHPGYQGYLLIGHVVVECGLSMCESSSKWKLEQAAVAIIDGGDESSMYPQ